MRSSSRTLSALAAVFALGVGWASEPARGAELLETFDGKPPAQILGGLLTIGRDGAWEGKVDGGAYTLRNDTDAEAVKYFNINDLEGDPVGLAGASVGVDLQLAGAGGLSGAGIVYRFDPANRTYLLFTLLGSNEYAVFARGTRGFRPVARGSVPGLRPGVNRLAVRSSGDRIEFLVNDGVATGMSVRGASGGSVGLAAIGKGTFTFDNFSIEDRG
ncbi:MAG TPA: hypothetical protein PKA13_02830 [Geminicoccaceae bacterium]|nr:hypothetical protein [Geminicoccus sp.]HMU48680.1 hypothetical protein [Geminicoccaceae bacterium]